MTQNQITFIQMEGTLFEDVQTKEIFEDQKTFVDTIPTKDTTFIMTQYAYEKSQSNFNLSKFVYQYFEIPAYEEPIPMTRMDLDEYIQHAWVFLERHDPFPHPYSTRISLPNPYIVPGGRFRELYYWDSFFTALGLVKNSDYYMFMDMIKNYSYLIDKFGFIPNGTRLYYLSRSQPPVFVLYIDLLKSVQGFDAIIPFIPKLEKEYEYWMMGKDNVSIGEAYKHIVKLNKDTVLNRYFDTEASPRPESYVHDYRLAETFKKDEQKIKVYQDIRAAAESGWDFSSRWFRNGRTMDTIATTDILPVDLNCLLYFIERKLSDWYGELDNQEKSEYYNVLAEKRKREINTLFWSEEKGYYFDYYWNSEHLSESWTLAGMFPLFLKIATLQQASKAAEHIEKHFLQKGGVLTTLNQTTEQWDKPNGWAPLQWITVRGLENYGYSALADEIKKRFTTCVFNSFKGSGSLFEKYNMLETNTMASGGEYVNQIGFGWTNGVIMDFLKK